MGNIELRTKRRVANGSALDLFASVHGACGVPFDEPHLSPSSRGEAATPGAMTELQVLKPALRGVVAPRGDAAICDGASGIADVALAARQGDFDFAPDAVPSGTALARSDALPAGE